MAKQNSDRIVSEAVRSIRKPADSFITLSTGVKIKPIRIPNMIFPEITNRFEKPPIPRVFIEDLGREEENPNDPVYIEKLSEWQNAFSKAIVDTMIVLGTETVFVPGDVEKETSQRWLGKLKVIGLDPGNDEILRYLYWIKYVAAPMDEDIQSIIEGVGKLAGVSESDVTEAIDQFRDNT